MAKPIEPTPILEGDDAKRFIQDLKREEENPSPERVKFLKKCIETYKKTRNNWE